MENNKNYIRVERHRWPDEIAAQKKKTKQRFIVVILCLSFFALGFGISFFSGTRNVVNGKNNLSDTSKFDEIYEIMKNDWYFGKDIDDLDKYLISNAIMGLTSNEYDAHTNYLDQQSATSFMQKLEGTIVGIGVQYLSIDHQFFITKVYADSPAKKADMREGDFIVKVNGISLDKKSMDEVKKLITGEEGSSVSVTILRGNEEITKEMMRSNVSTTAYGYEKGNVPILELSSFSESSAKECEQYLKVFKKKGYDSLVLDLRGNTGGYVQTAAQIASFFMEEDKIVIHEKERNGSIKDYVTKKSTRYAFENIVVLVDEQTASASEVLTACLRDNIGAAVIGMKTYGKGTVQVPKVFSDGSYLKYTTAEWLTPNNEEVNLKGIKPDVEVKLDEALSYGALKDENTYTVDSVGENVKSAQVYLSFLGYDVDRKDGYYSQATLAAVKAFQTAEKVSVDGIINQDMIKSLLTKVNVKWYQNKDVLDVQMIKAIEVANGK